MKEKALLLLEKLHADSEKVAVGRRVRPATITRSNLSEYVNCRSLKEKESFETTMQAARAVGAVSLVVNTIGAEEGYIQRIDLIDSRSLASFLGKVPAEDILANARKKLLPLMAQYPVLNEVLQRWEQLRPVRTFTAADVQDWLDAVSVVEFAKQRQALGETATPTYEASGKLFKDTKRIKRLTAPIDVLITGEVDSESRPAAEVLEEIGLCREEHPVRLSGNVLVERTRVTSILDAPYSGIPAVAITRLCSTPSLVMTIENPTTFHTEARRRCEENVLLIYTAGTPNPPWREMYGRLLQDLPQDVPVYHWGDFDEGGFRIASILAGDARKQGHTLRPWLMHPDNIPNAARRPASQNTITKMVHFAKSAGWPELCDAIIEAECTVEQESL